MRKSGKNQFSKNWQQRIPAEYGREVASVATLPCCHKVTLNNVPNYSTDKLRLLYRG